MRIVVVEDEAPIREGMAKILSKINTDYKVVGTAVDGEKGSSQPHGGGRHCTRRKNHR